MIFITINQHQVNSKSRQTINLMKKILLPDRVALRHNNE